ncbi:MAG: diguanylate cyclase, partial [Actinomycetota bacterium]|nr:diguanylate cyclase [Actinomycetota bacterium]
HHGPAVNPGLSVFAKRNIVTAGASTVVGGRTLLRYLPAVEMRRSFTSDPVVVPTPTDSEIDEVLAEGEFSSRDGVIDCGACGYSTCVEHAVAIHQGSSTWEMCFPLQRTLLEREGDRLREHATIDPLTGLWNRRVFNERLADEVARLRRYGSAVSLLMIDLDDFKSVNDRYGHVVGDHVLSAVGALLGETIRETDIPVRYGGDEFALILPGVDKTAAYAVAEKVRSAVRELRVGIAPTGNGSHVSIAVSIGVASAGLTCSDTVELLEAADGALYRAKESGRDRVMIAPG